MKKKDNELHWDIPPRRLTLEILTKSNPQAKEVILARFNETHRITFNTSDSVSGAANTADIVIGGMQIDKMYSLARSPTTWVQNWMNSRIVLTGGYEGNTGILFDGTIIEAKPNLNTADYEIGLKCMAGFDVALMTTITVNKPGPVNIETIVKEIAKQANLATDIGENAKNYQVNDFFVNNVTYIEACRQLSKQSYFGNVRELLVYIDGNTKKVKAQTLWESISTKTAPLYVGPSNLIGNPRPSVLGVDFDIRMDPYIQTGKSVDFHSVKLSLMTGKGKDRKQIPITVKQYSHHGDTKGKDWKTTVKSILVLTNEQLAKLGVTQDTTTPPSQTNQSTAPSSPVVAS